MNPKESAELNSLLQFIRDEHKIGVLLIEHDMSVVMEISDHIIVLDYGRKIAEGSPEQVRNDHAVIRAYLGEDEDEELPTEVATDLQRRHPMAEMLSIAGLETFYGNKLCVVLIFISTKGRLSP